VFLSKKLYPGGMYRTFYKIFLLPTQKGLEFPGRRGFCEPKTFKEMKPNQNFQRGGGGGLIKPSFCGGGMDIFWLEQQNYFKIRWE